MNTSMFFDHYYENAQLNCLLIMDSDGNIKHVSKSFTDNFGYDNEEIQGLNFSILFNETDRKNKMPEHELKAVIKNGQSKDENYIIDKQGLSIWCIGESLYVGTEEGCHYIVKDIVNLQSKKQLQLLLTETEILLEKIFRSEKQIPLMILDNAMRINHLNETFLELFEIDKAPDSGSSLSDLRHPFWSSTEIKFEISRSIVNREPMIKRDFNYETRSGVKSTLRLNSKIIYGKPGTEMKVYLMIDLLDPGN